MKGQSLFCYPATCYFSEKFDRLMEDQFTEWMKRRTSWRSYLSDPMAEDRLEKIKSLVATIPPGPLGNRISLQFVDREDLENRRIKLGTYGFIQNARYFIAGYCSPEKTAFLDYGYLMEKIILTLTGMELGTCWLGGTFDRSEFARALNLPEDQVIPAVTPVGIPTGSRGLGDRLIRISAGSRNRKNREEVFFDFRPGEAMEMESHPECQEPLEMVRIAPSASNLQPWRIICHKNHLNFYLERKNGYRNMFGKVDLQMIDMGIAMCHFDLTARQQRLDPFWEMIPGADEIKGWEYVITVRTNQSDCLARANSTG